MEKILKNERTNERTNEWTNEKVSERMEQKFMNEILSTTRENEENPFFQHDNQLLWQFLENIGNCYQQYFMWKIEKISQLRPKKIWKNDDFRYISGIFSRKNFFIKKLDSVMFQALLIRIFVQKFRKN